MPRFWQVDFHPKERPTAYLAEKGLLTPLNRLTHCGNVVTRAYSEKLRSGPPLEARTSWGRFVLAPDAASFAPRGYPATSSLGLGEVHYVPPPPLDWLDLPDGERRLRLLDFLHQHLLTLAVSLHWDAEPLRLAYQGLVRDGVEYSLTSRPKSSPDRRHTAHLRMHCDGEGDYWLRLSVVDRRGVEVRQSPLLVSGAEVRDFNAAKQTLKWLDKQTVTVTPWPDGFPSKYAKPFVLQLSDGL